MITVLLSILHFRREILDKNYYPRFMVYSITLIIVSFLKIGFLHYYKRET